MVTPKSLWAREGLYSTSKSGWVKIEQNGCVLALVVGR
jgi:hypothetical protein